jgi:RNA polymerase sigma factor (sigma-70 family)
MKVSDEELIARIRRGTVASYAVLVDRYKDSAMTLAFRMLKNREEAEEAVQDAFVRAYRGLGKFEGESRFGTWLYRITYNVCVSALRTRASEPVMTDFDETGAESSSTCPSPPAQAELNDTFRCIRKILETMPARYSSILTMFYLQELSLAEISGITGEPIGTVKIHLFRGRDILRKRLLKEYSLDTVV